MTKIIECKLGRTSYRIDDAPTPGVVRITRVNSDGTKEFFFPAELLIRYALEKAVRSAERLVKGTISELAHHRDPTP